MSQSSASTAPPSEPDRIALPHQRSFRGLRFGLWLHPEVSDRLREWTHLYKRLGIVLQHLAAHGRTTVVKACRDSNRGWLRSPLGGANGMQYYLWWTPQGSQIAKNLALPSSALLVRTVRHHHDHAQLAPGSLDDYLELSKPDDLIDGDSIAGRPWTDAQIDFVESEQPVRLLHGRPGSGKTTVLWTAIEARSAQRVLYLTWSSALTRHAEERFASFVPVDVDVIARDFATFVGEICGTDVIRKTLAGSRASFDSAISKLGRELPPPWRNRHAALHAELRGVLFGRAIPGEPGCIDDRGIVRLSDDQYRLYRSDFDGVGPSAATKLLRLTRFLSAQAVEAAFPELVAASHAVQRLQNNHLPDGFDRFDRIVVDEIQDLTLLEAAVVVELCQAIARNRGRSPWLLMAGDSGQTVRPTGFDWGPLSDLLASSVGAPAKFHLQEHLRCPSRIAEVVDRASDRYTDLEKDIRPTRQRRQHRGQHVDAHLIHVSLSSEAEAIRLLEQLADADEVAVLAPQNDLPPWVPEQLRDSVLTPEEAKGLEYQSVCVLDPSRVLVKLDTLNEESLDTNVAQLEFRTVIDHFRVTLSRATETLVFIDTKPDDEQRLHSLHLLHDAAPYSAEDLLDHFTHADASPEERVLVRTNDARVLVDSAPGRAWQRACQAFGLLGEPDLPNGVADPTVRREARVVLLETAARLLVEGIPKLRVERQVEVYGTAKRAADGSHETASVEKEAVEALWDWTTIPRWSPINLLDSALSLSRLDESSWLGHALLPAAQALREGLRASASDPVWAERFNTTDVEGWLRMTGYEGDVSATSRQMRSTAFDTLLKATGWPQARSRHAELLKSAESLLDRIGTDFMRLGRLREAQDRPEDAAKAYARAAAPEEVLRVLRQHGKWEPAVEFARGEIRADLEWLVDLEHLIARRPVRQNERLYEGELNHLETLLDTVRERTAGKRAGKE
ncbi:MAG: AAA family ATPase [Bryobacterales bacterium]|nr:AAA family ATPase [Bryobacterales bacterium]